MNDSDTSVAQLKAMVKAYCEARDWDQFHTPKDLAIGMITEASEVLEHFRFKSNSEMETMLKDQKKVEQIGDEMADTLYFLLRFSQMYGIDLASAFDKKMQKNEKNYPLEKSKGLNKKYNEL